MSDTKINVKVNKDNTVSISVEMGVKPPVWSREYRKFLPNEGFQRFHWTDAYKHLRKEGHIVDQKPSSGLETRYSFVDLEWAQKWPSEEAWIVRKK